MSDQKEFLHELSKCARIFNDMSRDISRIGIEVDDIRDDLDHILKSKEELTQELDKIYRLAIRYLPKEDL